MSYLLPHGLKKKKNFKREKTVLSKMEIVVKKKKNIHCSETNTWVHKCSNKQAHLCFKCTKNYFDWEITVTVQFQCPFQTFIGEIAPLMSAPKIETSGFLLLTEICSSNRIATKFHLQCTKCKKIFPSYRSQKARHDKVQRYISKPQISESETPQSTTIYFQVTDVRK